MKSSARCRLSGRTEYEKRARYIRNSFRCGSDPAGRRGLTATFWQHSIPGAGTRLALQRRHGARAMKLVIFGLTVTSSWGNGHATLWRGLLKALAALGHETTFFERDVPYYAAHRDLHASADYRIELYSAWDEVLPRAHAALESADAAIVTS